MVGRVLMKRFRAHGVSVGIVIVTQVVLLGDFAGYGGSTNQWARAAGEAPTPLLEKGHSVDWWFIFKLNAKAFPGCGDNENRACPFGGEVQQYTFGQQFVYASSENETLQKGGGCLGGTMTDPLGATFDAVYDNGFYYVVWNDQFYDDPVITGCT